MRPNLCKRVVLNSCDANFNDKVAVLRRELYETLLQKVRNHLMKHGSDLGGLGEFNFGEQFEKSLSVQIKVCSTLTQTQFLQTLGLPAHSRFDRVESKRGDQ